MSAPAILAIDQGTTNTKALLLNGDGVIVAQGTAPVPIAHPRSGWVEQDAEAIWQSVIKAVSAACASAPDAHISAIGISNQRESVALWDRDTGLPLGPVITWQCRRTSSRCKALKETGAEAEVLPRTGLPLDPLFPALKLRWLLDDALGKGHDLQRICAGTIDSWLIWKLTGQAVHATDRSNAARTQLFNIRDQQWDETLCALFDVPETILPTVFDSAHPFGVTANVPGLPDGIVVGSAIGDSHAALFGHCAFQHGDAKATFGTGSSVMAKISEFRMPERGVTTTIAWSIDGRATYALEGNILVSASALPFMAEILGLGGNVDALLQLAETVDDTEGVVLVPAMVGLGAPHWSPDARGIVSGLNFKAGRRHVARAAAESVALQVRDVFKAVEGIAPEPLGRVYVDGGPSRNAFLMGLVADFMNHPIDACEDSDASARGAAYLVGLTTGMWRDLDAIASLPQKTTRFQPAMDDAERSRRLMLWDHAVARCLFTPDAWRTDGYGLISQ